MVAAAACHCVHYLEGLIAEPCQAKRHRRFVAMYLKKAARHPRTEKTAASYLHDLCGVVPPNGNRTELDSSKLYDLSG